MSTDCREFKPYKRHQSNAHAACKTYYRRKGKRMDAQQWQVDYSVVVNTSDLDLCVGLGCCSLCDWDGPWWPMLYADSLRAMSDAEWLTAYWRPKVASVMGDTAA
jgi:hypothetical protein